MTPWGLRGSAPAGQNGGCRLVGVIGGQRCTEMLTLERGREEKDNIACVSHKHDEVIAMSPGTMVSGNKVDYCGPNVLSVVINNPEM